MKRIILLSLTLIASLHAKEFTVTNSSNQDIEVALGTPANPPSKSSSFKKVSAAKRVSGSKMKQPEKYTQEVPDEKVLLLVKSEDAPQKGFLYEASDSVDMTSARSGLKVGGAKLVKSLVLK